MPNEQYVKNSTVCVTEMTIDNQGWDLGFDASASRPDFECIGLISASSAKGLVYKLVLSCIFANKKITTSRHLIVSSDEADDVKGIICSRWIALSQSRYWTALDVLYRIEYRVVFTSFSWLLLMGQTHAKYAVTSYIVGCLLFCIRVTPLLISTSGISKRQCQGQPIPVGPAVGCNCQVWCFWTSRTFQ